jgi:hypothetical protein
MTVTSGRLSKHLAMETLWRPRSIQTHYHLDGDRLSLPRLLFVPQWCRQHVGHLDHPSHPSF